MLALNKTAEMTAECNDGIWRRIIAPGETLPDDIKIMQIGEMNAANLRRIVQAMNPDSGVQAVRCENSRPSEVFRGAVLALGKGWERDPSHSKTFRIDSSRELFRQERRGLLNRHFNTMPVVGTFFEAPEAAELFENSLRQSDITTAFWRVGHPRAMDEWLTIPMQAVKAVSEVWPRALVSYSLDGTMLNCYMIKKYGLHYHSFLNDMQDSPGDGERFKDRPLHARGFYINYTYADDSSVFASTDNESLVTGPGWNWNVFTTKGHVQGGSFHSGPIAKNPRDIQRTVFIAKVYPHYDDVFPDIT
jgi:hypothetical protein